MQLRKIEVYGFKSFADKSEIEFGSGITAIVGPNGSGKSNVSDAIRWALGEQSIRTLRGTKTEDVIFSGSSKRRPLGAAEVSLFFDNSDGVLPLEFSEVTITRRAFRTGESEYYINKTQCRLKDIHDLLADTGLGRDSMTVIGQNKIDELLNARPEDRRLMFEEAAGITKYKYRKREALRKLEETEANLTRVRDLTSEIESQLEPLEESAKRTAEYNRLHEQLISCQVTLLLDKIEKSEKMLENITLEQSSISDSEIASAARLASLEADRERQTIHLNNLDQDLNTTLTSINLMATEVERIDGKIALLNERLQQGVRDADRIDEELAVLNQECVSNAEKLSELQALYTNKQLEGKRASACLEKLQVEESALIALMTETEEKIKRNNEQNFDYMQRLINERNNCRVTERDIDAQRMRKTSLEKEILNYQEEVNTLKKQIECIESEKSEIQNAMTALGVRVEETSAQKTKSQAEFNDLSQQEKSITSKIESHSSRLGVLQSMQEEYEGFSRATKSVLKSGQPWSRGICGAVAQLLTVDDNYLTAIEIALGGSLQHIVTESDDAAKQAIGFLKTQKLGRTTFLPLNTIRAQRPRENDINASQQEGALGFASELIRFDPKYKPVIEYLLGRTLVVKDIDRALQIAKKVAHTVKIVTLDGELLTPGGALTGGSATRRDASVLGRHNEIDSLKSELSLMRKELAAKQQDCSAALALSDKAEAILQMLYSERHVNEIKIAEITLHAEKIQKDLQRMFSAQKTIEAEINSLQQEEAELQRRLRTSSELVNSLERQDTQSRNDLDVLQLELKEQKSQKDRIQAIIMDERIRRSTLQQEIQTLAAELTKLTQTELAKASTRNRFEQQKREIVTAKEQINQQLALEMDNRTRTQQEKEILEQKRRTVQDDKLFILADMQKTDRETKELRRKMQSMQAKLHELQLLSAKYEYDLTYSLEQLTERYELTRETANNLKKQANFEELEQAIYQLELHISQLGPVNPAAIDEFTRLKERYDFLQLQSSDLNSAKEYLASIVADIDNTMSKQFKTAFTTISQYFQDTFVRLFGGGQASLHLLEPDNLLESGIEIFVQPPGKKQQNLALLSGGERALTVIALLFAFLTYRPAPFSVVDEIDAALDEANVQRFSDFLKDYAQNTQFIVVTHRKGTMEAADTMIGITMEESGVSRLLSVKFMDKAG